MLKVNRFLQFQRNIFFGILAVAVAATLLVVIPQTLVLQVRLLKIYLPILGLLVLLKVVVASRIK